VRDGDIVIAKEMTRAEAEAAQKAAQPCILSNLPSATRG